MFSFFFKTIFVLFVIVLLVVIIPNPIHNRYPQWIKNYIDFRDTASNAPLDLEQLEIMNEDPLQCYKNADCLLVLCGDTPNCHSVSLNKEFFENHQENLPSAYQCPSEFELGPDDCGGEPQLDIYAMCEVGQCVKKHFLPTPTPLSSVSQDALYRR